MTKLNLTANDNQQKIILEHLTPLISDVLAEKINNGVRVTKDNKELISKKDLNTFMDYLYEEAKNRIPEKDRHGKQCVGMEGEDILGIAIHYFEEDSIHGKLFNLDGTEYQPPKPAKKTVTPTTISSTSYTPPKPAPKPQLNIFDMLASSTEPKNEIPEPKQTIPKPTKQISPIYEEYLKIQKLYPEFVIAYRLGDFYEIFGEDAEKISDDLDMTLTGRDFGLESRVPMIGIPQHAIKNYIARITEHDHKLAIVESADDIHRFISQNNQTVEIDTGEILSDDIGELSVEEMRHFDGDLSEPEELMTVSKLIGESPVENDTDANEIADLLNSPADIQPEISDDDFDIEKERQKMKAFDLESMIILQELFDDKITII